MKIAFPISTVCALMLGIAITFTVRGYQFGQSNHTIYLLDALHQTNPQLLAHDWFVTQTLQYHALFGQITRGLMGVNLLEPAFLIGYILLAIALHVAWLKIVRTLGGSVREYLISVVLFYILAGGTGLGMYQFLQDGALLPSNIANVAMLWGIYFWLAGKRAWAGAMLGIAGVFHLNHAIVGIVLWTILNCWQRRFDRAFWIGSTLAIGMSGINIAMAVGVTASASGAMPLNEFVDLYVRLRHPHHYDPFSWPISIWITFLLPLPFFAVRGEALRGEVMRIVAIFAFLLIVALLFAGIWFVNESLIQMSLWRFSIFIKLLSCIFASMFLCSRSWMRIPAGIVVGILLVGAGVLLVGGRFGNSYPIALLCVLCATAILWDERRSIVVHAVVLVALAIGLMVGGEKWLGIKYIERDGNEYLAMCQWVSKNTPIDALFVVPPQEQAFRLHAQRAIVVNFKAVPQLSAELIEWKSRLQRVLGMNDLRDLKKPMPDTLRDIALRYDALSPDHLIAIADEFGARYVVSTRPLNAARLKSVYASERRACFVYNVVQLP